MTRPARDRTPWSTRRLAIALCALSLAVRGLLWLGVAPVMAGDEYGYFDRAGGIAGILRAAASGEGPSPEDLTRAYGVGIWPPGHPALVGVALAVFAEKPRVARAAVALLSACTTGVVFALTLALAGRRAAAWAAGLHALYPSFVAYSQFLWSESSYVFVLLLALTAVVKLSRAESLRATLLLGAGAGALLGASVLTRISGAPGLVLVPLWLLFAARERRRRWLAAGLCAVVAAATLAPWQVALLVRERSPVILSTASGFNLYKNNRPPASREEVRREIREHAAARGLTRDRAARELALASIAADPLGFAARCAHRLRRIWNVDEFVLRHLLRSLYPPPPPAVFHGVFAALLLGFLLLAGLATLGAFEPGIRRADAVLLLGLAAAGAILPAVSIGNSRMGVPLLALLLPLAGHGAARLRQGGVQRASWLAAAGVLVLSLTSMLALPRPFGMPEVASSHFRGVVRSAGALFAEGTGFADCLGLRNRKARGSDVLWLELAGGDYRFKASGNERYVWTVSGRISKKFDVYALDPRGPMQLRIRSEGRAREVSLQPIRRDHWYEWRPTGIEGLEIWWCGYADLPP